MAAGRTAATRAGPVRSGPPVSRLRYRKECPVPAAMAPRSSSSIVPQPNRMRVSSAVWAAIQAVLTEAGAATKDDPVRSIATSTLGEAAVPVDENNLRLRFGMLVAKLGDEVTTRTHAEAYVGWIQDGYFEDVAIWEHKLWRDRPVLCDGDGPFIQVRHWYKQFFGGPLIGAPFNFRVGDDALAEQAAGHSP